MSLDEGQTIEVAAISQVVGRHKGGSPAGHKAMGIIKAAQTGEARIQKPEPFGAVGHFVNVDIARNMGATRQITGIMGGLQFGTHGGNVVQFPDLVSRADRELVVPHRNAHRFLIDPKVGVKGSPFRPDHNQLARLVGGDD